MAALAENVLGGFSQPSEDEKENYYLGLAGTPRLIARTSTTVWQHYEDGFSVHKKLSTVGGDHRLVANWCVQLRTDLISALDDSGVEWDTFYPIRIGSSHEDDIGHDVVLLIGLRSNGDCAWETAMRLALRCRSLLRAYDVWDVQVEILESHYVPMASSAAAELATQMDWTFSSDHPRDMAMADINEQLMPLLPYAGHRIEQEARPGKCEAKVGTMGVFFRLGKKIAATEPEVSFSDSTIYGLTNRHVAIGERISIDEDFQHALADDNSEALRLLSGGSSCISKSSLGLKAAIARLRYVFRETETIFLKHPDDVRYEELYSSQRACLEYADELKAALEHLDNETDTARCTVGTVAYSPKYGLGHHGHFKDWALIAMADVADADAGPSSLAVDAELNKVYMAGKTTHEAMLHAVSMTSTEDWRRLNYSDIKLDKNGFLRLHGRDLPPQPPFAAERRTAHLVAKRGQKTGLRFGITNEIEAVRRTPFTAGQQQGARGSLVSFHLLVLDFEGGPFSQPGDSGSCVFDCTGRVVGMLDGGSAASDVVRYMKKYRCPDDGGNGGASDLPDVADVPNQQSLPEGFTGLTADQVLGVVEEESAKENNNTLFPDVTFVTPIQWILEDIREFTGREADIL